ncbi:MAG: hypothetical protein AAF264_03670 [Pseudomonadota bacterium]
MTAFEFAARSGRLPDLVLRYLDQEDWRNARLRDGLQLAPRWWTGPVLLGLDRMVPCHGPGLEYDADPGTWATVVEAYAASLRSTAAAGPERLPPLIVEYREGELSIRDGGHGFATMRRLGWPAAWAVVWANDPDDHGRVGTALRDDPRA